MNSVKSAWNYKLKFADGSEWQISATQDAMAIADQFAHIFNLEHGNDSFNKLIFTSGHIPEDLMAGGCSYQKFRSVELLSNDNSSDVLCKVREDMSPELEILSISYAMYPIYRKIIDNGGAPFHCALVEFDGRSVILAARGDTGKSTCARRIPPPWNPLGDDEALVVKTGGERYEAHPLPTWSNFIFNRPQRTWDVQHHATLSGIFFIEQAPVDEATLLGQGEGAMQIYGASMQIMVRMIPDLSPEAQKYIKKQLFNNACEITKAVPTYRLKVLLDGQFWKEVERVLKL